MRDLPSRVIWASLGLTALLLLTGCGGDVDDEPVLELTATPLQPSPTGTPSPTVSPSPEVTSSPSPTPSPTAREASDTDRARFAANYRPENSSDLESAAVDVDGDGSKELVFAYVDGASRISRIDVAWWDGFRYDIGGSGEGGPAARIDRLRVSDVNGDGNVELVTSQSTSERASLSLWQVPEGERRLVRLVGRGGCADGSHTYGAVGARFTDRDGDGVEEIEATCNEAPLPPSAWRSDRYVWRDDAYRHEPPPPPPSPSPSPSPSPDGED